MATYSGTRENGNAEVSVDGAPLPPRNDLKNHSPDGCEWGYLGSGPTQLALAVLCHHFGAVGDSRQLADVKALALYQEFKAKLIVTLPQEGWLVDSHIVADTVSMVIKENAERYFEQAMQHELDNQSLNRELSECYDLLGDAEAGAR